MSIYQQTNTALGSQAVISLALDKTTKQVQTIFDELWRAIYGFEQAYSRFLPDSELTQFNELAGENVPISNDFKQFLVRSKELALDTDNLFNPFILPALQRAGYKHSLVDAKRAGPDYSNRRVASPDKLEIGTGMARIPKDAALDSGGIGKGYLLDLLGGLLANHNAQNYWISLGGDILASGSMDEGTTWEIDIPNAIDQTKTVARVNVPKGRLLAIATSGVTKRKGIQNNKAWHHIIDPATGEPALTDILTATVCMQNGVLADVYASCIVTLGTKKYEQFMKTHGIKDVMVQTADEKGVDIKIHGKRIEHA